MGAIRYGNLTAEIASRHGVRLAATSGGQPAADLLRPRRRAALPQPVILGRERQLAAAMLAIQQGYPIGFHAGCGYGKTTLLEHIAATTAERFGASSCLYLRADGHRVQDLLQGLSLSCTPAISRSSSLPRSARSYWARRASLSPSMTFPLTRTTSATCSVPWPGAAWCWAPLT